MLVGSDSYELAVSALRRRATRRLGFKRLIRKRLPNASATDEQLTAIADNVAMGRLLKGRVDAWSDCLSHFRRGFEAAFILEHRVETAPLQIWAVVGIAITGSLIAAGLIALAVAGASLL